MDEPKRETRNNKNKKGEKKKERTYFLFLRFGVLVFLRRLVPFSFPGFPPLTFFPFSRLVFVQVGGKPDVFT